nr:hypothetical protein [Tanacetum cinerariifolium]
YWLGGQGLVIRAPLLGGGQLASGRVRLPAMAAGCPGVRSGAARPGSGGHRGARCRSSGS